MSNAAKYVVSVTEGKQFIPVKRDVKDPLGNNVKDLRVNMCSTIDGRAIQTSIDSAGNVIAMYATSVKDAIIGTATFTVSHTIVTIDIGPGTITEDSCQAKLSFIDGKLYMALSRWDSDIGHMIVECWYDATGLGTAFEKLGTVTTTMTTGPNGTSSGIITPIIKLSNGQYALGVERTNNPAAVSYWYDYVFVSGDGVNWYAPYSSGVYNLYYATESSTGSIFEISEGLIVGLGFSHLVMWGNYGASLVGTASCYWYGMPFGTTDDGTIWTFVNDSVYTTRGLGRYIGPMPPTPASLTAYDTNYVWTYIADFTSGSQGGSILKDPAGLIFFGLFHYGGIFSGIPEMTRIRKWQYHDDNKNIKTAHNVAYKSNQWKRVN